MWQCVSWQHVRVLCGFLRWSVWMLLSQVELEVVGSLALAASQVG